MLQTPILFLIFNRPDTTKLVFDSIKKVKPTKLYIAADGARSNKFGEDLLVKETRAIVQSIDWNCEVNTLFRARNLGCKVAVSSAIDWFFENEEMGIVLEDDCLPNLSFYNYCEELLNYYKDDDRIMHIGGVNFQKGRLRGEGSYYFTNYNHVWGWASWRRAWKYYDVDIKEYNIKDTQLMLMQKFDTLKEVSYWTKIFHDLSEGKYNTWDYQWTYSIWKQGGVSILPNVNLISNIGFESGTHTTQKDITGLSKMSSQKIGKIIHPNNIIINKNADKFALNHYFAPSLARLYLLKFISAFKN